MNIQTLSGICVIQRNKILLLKQSDSEKEGNPGGWGPPAGHGEDGEEIISTAMRETREECGLSVQPDGIVECGLFRASDGNNYLIVVYSCHVSDDIKVKIDGDEIEDFRWVNLRELKSDNYLLRHPILKQILIKALSEESLPLTVFKDKKIQV